MIPLFHIINIIIDPNLTESNIQVAEGFKSIYLTWDKVSK